MLESRPKEVQLAGILKQMRELIDHAFDKGWKTGYEEHKKQVESREHQIDTDAVSDALTDLQSALLDKEYIRETYKTIDVCEVLRSEDPEAIVDSWKEYREKNPKDNESHTFRTGDKVRLKNTQEIGIVIDLGPSCVEVLIPPGVNTSIVYCNEVEFLGNIFEEDDVLA